MRWASLVRSVHVFTTTGLRTLVIIPISGLLYFYLSADDLFKLGRSGSHRRQRSLKMRCLHDYSGIGA